MKKNKIIYALLIYIAGSFFLINILHQIVNQDNIPIYTIASIICQLVILGFVYLINKKDIDKMWPDFKMNYSKYLKLSFKIWVVGFSFMIISAFIINYFILDYSTISTNEEFNRDILSNNIIFAIINFCVLVPMIEESVFRLSFNGIKNKYLFLIITGGVFALLHALADLDSLRVLFFFPYLALGLTFSLSYLKTKNLFPAIIIHSWHNTITLILLFIF